MGFVDRVAFGLAISCSLLGTASFPVSIANERPVHTIVLAFVICGFALSGLNQTCPGLFRPPPSDRQDGSMPLHERSSSIESRKSSANAYANNGNPVNRKSRFILIAAIAASCLRIEVYRRISKATECTVNSLEVFLPILLAFYDAVRGQQARNSEPVSPSKSKALRSGITSIYQRMLNHTFRYLPSAIFLSMGFHLVPSLWNATNSTYICPIVVRQTTTIPLLQLLALFLDFYIAISIAELCLPTRNASLPDKSRGPNILASVLITTAIIWSAVGVIVYIAKPQLREWLLPYDLLFSLNFGTSVVAQMLLLSVLCVSSFICIIHYGVLYVTMSLMALCVTLSGLHFIWSSSNPFPPVSSSAMALSFLLIYSGWWLFETARVTVGQEKKHSVIRYAAVLVLLFLIVYPPWSRSAVLNEHPIDTLIRNAKSQDRIYLKSVKKSHSLQDAVVEYKRRYATRPPPGFDVWYEYATNRSATIIDEFDQIFEDLLPFRLTSPADLRLQTWEMVSNPWNEISGITIRDGVASVQENVLPTHRWMLEGVAILINSFARYLPDMDLAFNLNDESRVAIPYAQLERAKQEAQKVKLFGFGSWSTNRSAGWLPIPDEPYHESVFRDLSFHNTFSKFGSVGCHPKSDARRHQHVASNSHLCLSCIAPHSNGQFVSNWSLAADVCHQPDLAHLHGFYLSPAAFKTSAQAMPVFSQSKPHGYNDILYPSAWNYMDKATYAPTEPSGEPGTDSYQPGFPDPDYRMKENVLFWRGATSEGVSAGDQAWRGMTRQRFVHMANNLTTSQHDYATILLPALKGNGFRYQRISGPAIKDLGLVTDVAIVERIVRCGGDGLHDCTDQETEFALVGPSEFQSHWRYRYLFDLDGAGFSGRFLPFIKSKSLPFKTALFREWYDSRLVAWRHFVPQDLRLHGVWSTLAYFAGVNGTIDGQKVEMAPHLKEGNEIATAGRDWAREVLRKEDMEVYFFRLLLEWGRLTDNSRESLGFSI